MGEERRVYCLTLFDLLQAFPGLAVEGFTQTSDATPEYNCIGWAATDDENWWWPIGVHPTTGKNVYWPRQAPNKLTIRAFEKAFRGKGFKALANGNRDLEPGYEKIAIYAKGTIPTHAARQLRTGEWTHKLGQEIDVTASLTAIEGNVYGSVVAILRRKRPANS